MFSQWILAILAPAFLSAAGRPLLPQNPTISKTHVVFQYAGDLWSVSRDGGAAIRLTSGQGEETRPIFSPDGEWVAFTGEYDGNIDVFIVKASGGVPKRLTWHPSPDSAVGWTPDSKSVIFRSSRAAAPRGSRLYSVPVEGGWPEEFPFHQAFDGSLSPDQQRIAYVAQSPAFRTWKMYRGGRTTEIAIARLKDSRRILTPNGRSLPSRARIAESSARRVPAEPTEATVESTVQTALG